jgi:hypothetical protein
MNRVAGIAVKTSREVGRSLPSAAGRAAAPMTQSGKISPLIPIFVFSLVIPIHFYIGPLRLSPYRLLLIATFIPCLIGWLSRSMGRIRLPDIFMLLAGTWGAVVLLSLHGVDEAAQSAGIFALETFGTFIFARRYIPDVFAFQRMVGCLVLMVIFLLPFAVYENFTGSPILIEMFGKIFSVFNYTANETRLGLSRAQVTLEHPILFGVVCSSAFALSFYVLSAATRLRGRLASCLVTITTFSSLSSGAFLSLVVQTVLILWDKITASLAQRWKIFGALTILAYFVVDFLSNRSGIEVFISYLTFSADNSYMRMLIWRYGTQSVMQHPIFGIGLNEWNRPPWMGGSMDNFWLVIAVRYGIPGFLFMAGGFVSVCFGLGRLRALSPEGALCRKGLIVTLCGLAATGCTVHFWNATYVLLIFLLGSGMWMFERGNRIAVAATSNAQNRHSVIRPALRGCS